MATTCVAQRTFERGGAWYSPGDRIEVEDEAFDELVQYGYVSVADAGLSGTYQRARLEDIRDHGATDGADNTAAINAAINALDPAQGGPGGVVWLANILSGVTSTITQPDGVALMGAGEEATTLRADAAISAVLVLAGKRETISGFMVDSNSNATNGVVSQDAARTLVSYVQSKHATSADWLIDETWDAASGNNVLMAFEHCLAEGGDTTPEGWVVATGQVNANGILWHHSHSHSHTGSGMIMRGDGNRVEGGTWVNNGAYGIDAAAGQGHRFVHPWLEGNTAEGIVFSGAVRCEVHELPVSGMQGVDWANSDSGNVSREANNAGTEGGLVYRGGLHPELADDAHLPGDGINTFPRGYSAFKDVAGIFPAGAGGHVETYADEAEGRQRNWAEGSNVIHERTSTDGATWQSWRIRGEAFPFYLPAVTFRQVFGSVTENRVSRNEGLSFPDSGGDERAEKQIYVPEGSGLTATLYWANETTATGDVQWDILRSGFADGRDLTTIQPLLEFFVATAGSQNVLTETPLTNTFASAGEVMSFVIQRTSGSANDTLSGAVTAFGLLVRQA